MGLDSCLVFTMDEMFTTFQILRTARMHVTSASDFESRFVNTPIGQPLRKTSQLTRSKMTKKIGAALSLYDTTFVFASDFLRARYLRRTGVIRQQQEIVLTSFTEAKHAEAMGYLCRWNCATQGQQRLDAFRLAKAFVSGQDAVEDEVAASIVSMPEAATELKKMLEGNPGTVRYYIQMMAMYNNKIEFCELLKVAWQDLHDIFVETYARLQGIVSLLWADPFYGAKFQPKLSEQVNLRVLIDYLTKPGSVIIVFGRPLLLAQYWQPIFADRFGKSLIETSTRHFGRSSVQRQETSTLTIR
jgi:hypothetical protein